jgi:hypothetical protein
LRRSNRSTAELNEVNPEKNRNCKKINAEHTKNLISTLFQKQNNLSRAKNNTQRQPYYLIFDFSGLLRHFIPRNDKENLHL